ncbi:MAG TPA: HD domain-containing protein [Chthonomonadaceae bacterium]|nr:HD domain-containing protein [Chthonomonadaceae bacterium]
MTHAHAEAWNAQIAIERLREATRNSPYENRLYLVGGLLRDRALGLPLTNDLDLVLEGDAVALAQYLYARGLSQHYPVLYPRFGTAMIHVGAEGEAGCAVELVSARAESYMPDSRKPDVRQGTLQDDVYRRDFTINTLLENLHTGEVLDLTGRAWEDLKAGILRTPLDPHVTFFDDPLRMLRAVRLAARFGFTIEAATWKAIGSEAERLRPPAIAHERIREEFVKIARLPGPKFRDGMEKLLTSNLLEKFLPEMLPMIGCTQGHWHRYDVWTHTLVALEALPDAARLETRLGLLWHDIGKPPTRTVTDDGQGVRFYGHPGVGTEIARAMMNRLKFSNDEIRDVTALIHLHMRLGEYRSDWADPPVKRLIRDCGAYLDDLFVLTRCDMSAVDIPPGEGVDLAALRARVDALNALSNVRLIESPLDGNEIMQQLGIEPGPHLREAKEFLTNEVIEGRLAEGDKSAARNVLKTWWESR